MFFGIDTSLLYLFGMIICVVLLSEVGDYIFTDE